VLVEQQRSLDGYPRQPIEDRTGLTGKYDLEKPSEN
jgi:hypothetical protein